jgi:hypothetical protein
MMKAAPSPSPIAMHSAASPDWGTPMIGKQLALRVLAPAGVGCAINLDYASSAYWHGHWPGGHRPAEYLDGRPGRDVLNEAARRRAIGAGGGTGFFNPPGLDNGKMVQECWRLFVDDWIRGMLVSGVWIGFSLEQTASLQNVGVRHPLSRDVATIVPSRRGRYLLHPEQLITICEKKRKKRERKSDAYKKLTRQIKTLRDRKNDVPVQGDAPTHASYVSILLATAKPVRAKQIEALRLFLDEQSKIERSWFQKVAIVGDLS